MKISELITELDTILELHGDISVYVDKWATYEELVDCWVSVLSVGDEKKVVI